MRWPKEALALLLAVISVVVAAGCFFDGGEDEAGPVTPPVEDPARAKTLAGRYEPDLMIERDDHFWPVAVRTIDLLQSSERGLCLAAKGADGCPPVSTNELEWNSAPKLASVNYPADDNDPDEQHDGVVWALKGEAPGTRARMYYYVTGRSPERPVSLQYWFYYPYNYLRADAGPFVVNTDLHEGDFEGMSLLLSARKHEPVYVWMPRHTGEGERFVWNQGALERHGDHPVGFVARGSHATYESCGRKFRTAFAFDHNLDIPDDNVSCSEGATYELGSTIPAINLARTWWACWPGRLGYAPYHSSPLDQLHANGPLSPLFQQKFDLRDPHPCEKVDAPAHSPASPEVLADPDTATALGASGGRLNDLFRSCDEWSQRPPAGSYMVACDPATLESFFESGLEDPGEQDLRVVGNPAPTGPTVPAVFASSEPQAVDRATIRTRQVAHPEIYVAVRDGKKLARAEFSPLTLKPGQRLRLRRDSESHWRLVDLAAGERVVAGADVRVTEAPISPQAPAITGATRRGAEIDLSFSGGTSPATRLVAFAAASRRDLIEAGRLVGSVRGEEPGAYELTIADPDRKIHFLRVVASLDGALAPSPIAAVVEGP